MMTMKGIDEPLPRSALSLVPEHEQVWRECYNEPGWYYCPALSTIVTEQIRRKTSPHFARRELEGGTIAYECLLLFRSRPRPVSLLSGPCASTLDALNSVLDQAKAVPFEDSTNWHNEIIARTKYQGIRTSITNTADYGLPSISCHLEWGNALKQLEVRVSGFPTIQGAVGEALKRALAIGPAPPIPKAKPQTVAIPKPPPAEYAPRKVKQRAPMDASTAAALEDAKARWNVERNWLMKRSAPTKEQTQRFHDLNTFLILLDPLRCLEIDRSAREIAIGRLATELTRIQASKSPAEVARRRAELLCALLGKRFADPGTVVTPGPAFITKAASGGADPAKVIADLTAAQLLRRSPSGELSLSTLGSNLMERSISNDIQPGSVGASLSEGMQLALLNLKDALG